MTFAIWTLTGCLIGCVGRWQGYRQPAWLMSPDSFNELLNDVVCLMNGPWKYDDRMAFGYHQSIDENKTLLNELS